MPSGQLIDPPWWKPLMGDGMPVGGNGLREGLNSLQLLKKSLHTKHVFIAVIIIAVIF